MSGKALWVGLVGYIRCGSTKGVPLGGVLKEKGIPEETNTEEKKGPWGGVGRKVQNIWRDSQAARYLEFGELVEVSLGGEL